MGKFIIEPATHTAGPALLTLYRAVAATPGGLARTQAEITTEYVTYFLQRAQESGLILVVRPNVDGPIIGEIHSYALGPRVFAHILGELTIAVHPDYQGQGVGKALFTELLRRVEQERPDISRVELIARESNRKAIAFYQKLGFQIEGRLANRIRSIDGNSFEADIPMAWHRNVD
jgi:ribosomal protein S18 acetylase RimI-like enzyme